MFLYSMGMRIMVGECMGIAVDVHSTFPAEHAQVV